jgi:hypothetical protein
MPCIRKGRGVPPRAWTWLVEALTHPPQGADGSPVVAQGTWGSSADCPMEMVPCLRTRFHQSSDQNAWRIELGKARANGVARVLSPTTRKHSSST